jgi:hypothetical protein
VKPFRPQAIYLIPVFTSINPSAPVLSFQVSVQQTTHAVRNSCKLPGLITADYIGIALPARLYSILTSASPFSFDWQHQTWLTAIIQPNYRIQS